MKYIINTDDLYGGDIYKSMLLMGTNGKGEVIVQKFNLDELEELNSDYINEHYGSLQDDAYNRGYEDGAKSVENWNNEEKKLRLDEAFDRGLTVAWEAARKIVCTPHEKGLGRKVLDTVFGDALDRSEIMFTYSAQEAIAKLKAYEEKQADRIKVGDEVIWKCDKNIVIVVTSVYTVGRMEWCDGVTKEGKAYSLLTENARKTGKHYDIQSILEEMKKCGTRNA